LHELDFGLRGRPPHHAGLSSVLIRAIRVRKIPSPALCHACLKLLIKLYLSFFDKKDLTNGIDWFIPCAMSTTGMILILAVIVIYLVYRFKARRTMPSNVARLNRITQVSIIFRLLIYLGLIFQFYLLLAYYFGWPGHDHWKIVIAPHHIYTSPNEMPPEIQVLWLVQTGLAFWAMIVLSCLFHLYERGTFFATKNVNYIRFFGYYLMISWVIDDQMQSKFQDVALSTGQFFGGFLIIFIAWIMDEGRKIQEEQELTV
jgi:hypothetical protein